MNAHTCTCMCTCVYTHTLFIREKTTFAFLNPVYVSQHDDLEPHSFPATVIILSLFPKHYCAHTFSSSFIRWYSLLAIVNTAAVNRAVQASLQHDGLDPFQCMLRVVCLDYMVVLLLASWGTSTWIPMVTAPVSKGSCPLSILANITAVVFLKTVGSLDFEMKLIFQTGILLKSPKRKAPVLKTYLFYAYMCVCICP